MRLNLLACLLATVAATATGGAAAQASDPEAPGELETVTVFARRITPVNRVAATVTVISGDSIQRNLVGDLKDLVRYEPGLSVRSDPMRFGAGTVAVRGVGGNRVAIEIDGIPAASGFAVGSFSDSGRSFVDPAFVERVEVLRGPASALYGSDAIGGVVAVTTLAPRSLLGAGERPGLRSEAGYSGRDDGWHAVAIGAVPFGESSALLGYAHRTGHEFDTAADVVPNPRDYRSDAVLAKLQFDGMPGGPLTLAAEGGRVEQQTSIDAFLGLAGTRFVNTTLLEGDDRADRYRLSAAQKLGPASIHDQAEWRLYAQGTRTRQDTLEQRRAVPPRIPPVEIDRRFRLEDRTLGAELTATRDFERAGTGHALVYGFEVSRTRLEELRDGLQTDLASGMPTNVILGERFPLRDFPISDVTRAGAFLQDELRPGNSPWTLIPAVRADYYRLEPQPDRLYREDNPSAVVVSLDDFAITPKLGVVRELGPSLSAFVQYARGFRAPPPEDVNIGLDLPLFNIRALPNPDLKPEQSDGYELGLRWGSGGASLAVSAYYTDYRDFIESKVNLGPDPQTGVTLFQSQNVEEAHLYGAELSASIRPGEWVPALGGLSARLTAAWARGEDLVREEPLNSVDPASAVLSIAYEVPTGRWGGELVTTAVAAKNAVDDSRVDLYRTDGYATLDLLAHYDFGGGLSANLGLFNLTGAEYIEWCDVRGRANGDPLIPYYTRPGRNVSLTLRWGL